MRIIRIIGFAIAAAGVLTVGTEFRGTPGGLVSVVQAAQSGCSNNSLRGNYGFQIRGTIVGFGPIVGVALVTFDGGGNFTQTDNVSVNGFPQMVNRPGSGTYSVNADCTGTQTLNSGGQVVHTTFVIAANGNQVFDEVTDPNLVITGIGKRVDSADDNENEDDDFSPLACSLHTIKGSYGISTTGSILAAGPVGLVADVGTITFDGNGGASQSTTVILNGMMILPNRMSLAGSSYTVNSDCTGELSITLPSPTHPIPSISRFVVVDGGNQLLLVNTGFGRALAGVATRQHARRR
jgi:hypothetical protein